MPSEIDDCILIIASHLSCPSVATHQVNKAFEKYEKQMRAAKQSGKNSKANQEKVKQAAARQQVKRTGGKKDAAAEDEGRAGSSAPQKWSDYSVEFHFPEPTELQPPLMQLIDADFKYPGGGGGMEGREGRGRSGGKPARGGDLAKSLWVGGSGHREEVGRAGRLPARGVWKRIPGWAVWRMERRGEGRGKPARGGLGESGKGPQRGPGYRRWGPRRNMAERRLSPG